MSLMNLYSQLYKNLNSKSNPLLSYTLLKCFKLSDSDGNLMLVSSIIHKFQNISLKPKHLAESEITTCYNVKSPFRSADFENNSVSGTFTQQGLCAKTPDIWPTPTCIDFAVCHSVCVCERIQGWTYPLNKIESFSHQSSVTGTLATKEFK